MNLKLMILFTFIISSLTTNTLVGDKDITKKYNDESFMICINMYMDVSKIPLFTTIEELDEVKQVIDEAFEKISALETTEDTIDSEEQIAVFFNVANELVSLSEESIINPEILTAEYGSHLFSQLEQLQKELTILEFIVNGAKPLE